MEIRKTRGPSSEPNYSTRDFYLASALLAKGAHFLRIDRQGSVGFFIFTDQLACEDMAEAYFQGELLVSAKELTNSIRSLKDVLFAAVPQRR